MKLDIELPVIYANLHWTEVRIIREAYISKQKISAGTVDNL
jgi:hypothetical protein